MRKYFGYIRVSTVKQGEKGVSLQEQRAAIERHAERTQLALVDWFEERETAAKQGRPVFTRMMRLLRQRQADGVVIHKIDRSARNLKDWADLGSLIDAGIDVQFANESLDLRTRGGRLSADIQAVVAADFIRNLREETRKGVQGRLKQGLYPLPAPIGYLDRGKGQVKEIDLERGPLVRRAFELYDTGRLGIHGLVAKLEELGLRNRRGRPVSKTGVSVILNNPFYMGLIRIKTTGQTVLGKHQPLISAALWKRVQDRLRGKSNTKATKHDYLFRRMLACEGCGYHLIGERQKGRVYYRCHSVTCPKLCAREDVVEGALRGLLAALEFTAEERAFLLAEAQNLSTEAVSAEAQQKEVLSAQIGQVRQRLERLTDALLDGVIDKGLFDERRTALLVEERTLQERLGTQPDGGCGGDEVAKILELGNSALVSYEMANVDEKRELLNLVTSNRTVQRNGLVVELRNPFRALAERSGVLTGAPQRSIPRTSRPGNALSGRAKTRLRRLARVLLTWTKRNRDACASMMQYQVIDGKIVKCVDEDGYDLEAA